MRCQSEKVTSEKRGKTQIANFVSQRTFSHSCHSLGLITVCFLESIEDIGFRPVGEHFADHRSLVAILLSKLGKLALVLKRAQVVVSSLEVLAVGSATASAGETPSATSAGASAA